MATAMAVAAAPARADSYSFSFSGNGITASGMISVGPQSTNSSNPPGYEITGISGTFSDTNAGVSGAITGLATPVSYVNDPLVSGFASTDGLSHDDLFYPGADSPTVCFALDSNGNPFLEYPFSGGVFDIYGVAFTIGGSGGYIGELWSNGDVGGGPIVYAAGLADANGLVDNPNAVPGPNVPPPGEYGSLTTSETPEPSSLFLLGTGLSGMAALWRRRKTAV